MMEKTIEILEKHQCTGCGACYNKCPVDAISMEWDDEGFLYPVIKEESCIGCGQCQMACPELNEEYRSRLIHEEGACYAMMADDEIRMVSSSGGMFTLLAEKVLEQGGIVCGAVYTEDYMYVKHIIIDSKEDLKKLRGSKYVQSDTGDTYKEAKRHLQNGKYVLFTGCPCQIAGMKTYLGKEYKTLITADIICHGVPSPAIYKKYLNEKSGGRKLAKVDFRDKSYWGWGTATSLFFEDGSAYRGDCYSDEYWIGFLGGMETRQCCGNCRYANVNRVGDFTLGDFWGVSELDAELSDGKGTSLVMVNSEKARSLIVELETYCKLIRKMDLESVLELAKKRNGQLLKPTQSHWARNRFFEMVENKALPEALDYARNSKYDVGITGWWYNENYGGTLTYFALHQTLKKMGLSVLMIAKCSANENYKPKYESIPYRFAMKKYCISKNYKPTEISVLNDHCKTFISGSDQLFNPTLWEYSGPQYFLNYVSNQNNIISYASSFGNGFVDKNNLKFDMAYWLNRFDALSVREDYGVDIFHNVFHLHAEKVMDPVFLCDVEEYKKLAMEAGKTKENAYVLSFFLDPNKEKRNAILSIAGKLELPYVNLLNAIDFDENMKSLSLDNTKPNIDIEEWLFYYMNADYVITDSFHGTCFAIIFRKKFISIANRQRGEKRFVSLLQDVGLIDRLIYDIKELEERPELFEEIDYDEVYKNITPKVRSSYQWLENAIKHPKPKDIDTFNVLNTEIERLKEKINNLQRG